MSYVRALYEETAIILDFLPNGRPDDERPIYMRESLAHAIGDIRYTILELVVKRDATVKTHDRVNIGKENREEIEYVKQKISYDDLTGTAKSELPYIVEEIVSEHKEDYVSFFNRAGPITTRFHKFELLPGVGKKLMWELITSRKKKEFKNFDDLTKRIHLLSQPEKTISKRIVDEIKGADKYIVLKNWRWYLLIEKNREDRQDDRQDGYRHTHSRRYTGPTYDIKTY